MTLPKPNLASTAGGVPAQTEPMKEEKESGGLVNHPELKAMNAIHKILHKLGTQDAAKRVLGWINDTWMPAKRLPMDPRD